MAIVSTSDRLCQKSFRLLRRFTPRNDYLCKSLRAGGEAISLFYRRLKSVFKFDFWHSLLRVNITVSIKNTECFCAVGSCFRRLRQKSAYGGCQHMLRFVNNAGYVNRLSGIFLLPNSVSSKITLARYQFR